MKKDKIVKKTGKYTLIKSHVRVIQKCRSFVANPGWLFVLGNPGQGKTAIKEYLEAMFHGERYVVVSDLLFSKRTRASGVWSVAHKILKALSCENMYTGLAMDSVIQNLNELLSMTDKRVVVMIDECHKRNLAFYQDLKNLAFCGGTELGFTLICFGHPTGEMVNIVSTDEIGKRCNVHRLDKISKNEVLEIVNNAGFKFKNNDSSNAFYRMCSNSPLGVVRLLSKISEKRYRLISVERLNECFLSERLTVVRERLNLMGVSYQEIIKAYKERYREILSIKMVSDVLNGKSDLNVVESIVELAEEYTTKKIA